MMGLRAGAQAVRQRHTCILQHPSVLASHLVDSVSDPSDLDSWALAANHLRDTPKHV